MLVTVNNTKLSQFNFPKIDNLEIVGLDETESKKLYENIKSIKKKKMNKKHYFNYARLTFMKKNIDSLNDDESTFVCF